MGYDMNMGRVPTNRIVGYEPQYSDRAGHFQARNQWMRMLGVFMGVAGVIDPDVPSPHLPAWPPPAGVDEARANAIYQRSAALAPPATEAERSAVAAWSLETQAVRGQRSPRPGLVPLFKFTSNDEWLVHADEAQIIADGLRKFLATHSLSLTEALAFIKTETQVEEASALASIRSWATYNAVASAHGGYRVS